MDFLREKRKVNVETPDISGKVYDMFLEGIRFVIAPNFSLFLSHCFYHYLIALPHENIIQRKAWFELYKKTSYSFHSNEGSTSNQIVFGNPMFLNYC